MSPRPLSDLIALAAQLRLMALGLVAELLALLGAGRLAAALRRRMARELGQLERFATGILVLAALPQLPRPLALHGPGGRRPLGAARGFVRVARDANDMRAMRRKLFPRMRDPRRRLARFDAVLADIGAHAARLAPHMAHIPPDSRLALAAPCATPLPPRVPAPACAAIDSS